MKTTDYTKGTLRKDIKPEEAHWLWKLVGMMLAMIMLSLVGAYIAENLL